MTKRYALITYPNGYPILAETTTKKNGEVWALGHGKMQSLVEGMGAVITPLVPMTDEFIKAIKEVMSIAEWESQAEDSCYFLRTMLAELEAANDK